jgi:hypothetical protein
MDIQETLDCMNSDYKLWSKAESQELPGGRVVKTLNLPWGIGDVVVTLEGLNDAGKRRDAVGSYGEYIRGVIEEAISEDAVTARAQQAAARTKQDDSGDSPIYSGEPRVRNTAVQETANAEAGKTHQAATKEHAGLGETLAARRLEIEDDVAYFTARRDEAERELRQLAKDRRAIEAAIASLGEDDEDGDE